jgi:UDP-N-acetylglucosamine acyltransferase
MIGSVCSMHSPADIHPLALVDKQAKIGHNVKIGPYCCVGPNVELQDNVQLISHVVIEGHTKVGQGTVVYPFASLGFPPQDLKYKGEPTELIIGAHCIVRENVTMSIGTAHGHFKTIVGDHCYFMMSSHVGHDCRIGNHVIMCNGASLSGHVDVGDYAYLGGLSGVHQFVRIGHHAMIGGMSGVEHDVIPYGIIKGKRARLYGLNLVGLKRRGFPRDKIQALREAYKLIFENTDSLQKSTLEAETLYQDNLTVMEIVNFLKAESLIKRICRPEKSGTSS